MIITIQLIIRMMVTDDSHKFQTETVPGVTLMLIMGPTAESAVFKIPQPDP